MNVHGDLKLLARHDLGDLGPAESPAVTQSWPWFYHLPPFAVWLLPLAAIVLLKENHNARVLQIAFPMLAVILPWAALRLFLVYAAAMPSGSLLAFDIFVTGFTAYNTVLLLVAARLIARNRVAIAFVSWVLMIGVFAFTAWTSAGAAIGAADTYVSFAFLGTMIVLPVVLTGVCCRKHYSGVKFALWLAAWCVILCTILATAFITWMLILGMPAGAVLIFLLTGALFGGAQLGIGLYLMLLPFFVLAMNSAFFRPRFYGCFRLKGMLPAKNPVAPAETPDAPPV